MRSGETKWISEACFPNSGEGVWIDCVSEAGSEAHRAEHAKLVFGKPALGFADSANNAGGEVGASANIIEHFTGVMFHEQAVDGEVAARNVFLRSVRVNDLVWMAAIGIANVAAERSDFNLVAVAGNKDYTELGTDTKGIGKQLHDLSGRGVGGYVVIGWIAIEQNVADTTADQQGLIAVLLKRCADRIGQFSGIHVLIMRQPVAGDRNK